jgi:hypothetical protein
MAFSTIDFNLSPLPKRIFTVFFYGKKVANNIAANLLNIGSLLCIKALFGLIWEKRGL